MTKYLLLHCNQRMTKYQNRFYKFQNFFFFFDHQKQIHLYINYYHISK
jgi:hypothetical protein